MNINEYINRCNGKFDEIMKIYNDFISEFKEYPTYREAQCKGYEAHHINLVAYQKKDRNDSTLDDRSIRLTCFEHVIAHYLIALSGNPSMIYAFSLMANANYQKLSDIEKTTVEELEEYTKLREEVHKIHSEEMKGEKNPMYGKRGKDTPHYGKYFNDETKKINFRKNKSSYE